MVIEVKTAAGDCTPPLSTPKTECGPLLAGADLSQSTPDSSFVTLSPFRSSVAGASLAFSLNWVKYSCGGR
jgi:hypothetical protein